MATRWNKQYYFWVIDLVSCMLKAEHRVCSVWPCRWVLVSCWLDSYVTVGGLKCVLTIINPVLCLSPPPQQSSYPIWEDFITKAGKLQSQLRWDMRPYFKHILCSILTFTWDVSQFPPWRRFKTARVSGLTSNDNQHKSLISWQYCPGVSMCPLPHLVFFEPDLLSISNAVNLHTSCQRLFQVFW